MNHANRLVLCFLVLGAGCDGGGGEDDAGGGVDAVVASCAGASDGTPCGAGRICLTGACGESRCGDGFTDPGRGEGCDDGNDVAFDGCEPVTCQSTCTASSECDDGVMCNGAEECSAAQCVAGTPLSDGTACDLTGGGSGVCRTGDCVMASCGDGLVTGEERCDDGNDVDGDGCESDCRFTCEVDASRTNTWYVDCDGDDYAADGASSQMSCLPPSATACGGGWTLRAPAAGARDCDDAMEGVFPGAIEVCDGVDQDCDSMIDDGVLLTFYRDGDVDGAGDPSMTMMACAAPSGFVDNADDCDDDCATCLPGGTETCDEKDNDCDDSVDEGVLTTFYRDTDGDTYGSTSTLEACTAPANYVDRGGDCDDGDSGAFPGQTMFFTRARMGGGYDFDCSGGETRQYTSVAPSSCTGCTCPVGFCCAGMCAGWSGGVPSCGGSGTWRETDCTCGFPSSSRTQGCR